MSDLTPEQRQYRKANELFWQARELNKEHQLNFLKQVCGDNLALFNQILTLLNEENNLGILDQSNAFDLIGLSKIDLNDCAEEEIMTPNQNTNLDDFIGKLFNNDDNHYKIIELIGKGGMGTVFLANDLDENKEKTEVAIKILLHFTTNQPEEDIKRFHRECKILIKLDHYNIVKMINYGEAKFAQSQNNYHFLVMEYLKGCTLKNFLGNQKPTLVMERKLSIISQICDGLHVAHTNGVTHRDLKPDNIMVLSDDKIKIIDFGISKNNNSERDPASTIITKPGWIIGTPQYMSPEQCCGRAATIESDIYSLGLIIYEILCGQHPFVNCNKDRQKVDWLEIHLNEEPENHLEEYSGISQELVTVIMSMLKKDPKQRPSLTTVIDSINKFSPNEATTIKIEPFQFDSVEIDSKGKTKTFTNLVKQQYREDLGNEIKLEMVEIPGGKFLMGTRANYINKLEAEYRKYEDNQAEAHKWAVTETKQHKVTLQSFHIGKYQITQAQWEVIMGYNPSQCKGDDNPVESVSWDEATEFCKKLSEKTRRKYRLPSEAEWEYACRAGQSSPFAFGETIIPEIVNYNSNFPYGRAPIGKYRGKTIPVGSLRLANEYGLYDMHGNVWEWCQDTWQDSYKNSPADGSPWEIPSNSIYRVLRGGSYKDYAYVCRSANRDGRAPNAHEDTIGFRVVFAQTFYK